MQIGQMIRRLLGQVHAAWAGLVDRVARRLPAAGPGRAWRVARGGLGTRRLVLLGLGLILLYYTLGALLMHEIDDDLRFSVDPNAVIEGESRSVALAAGLIDRELNRHGWVGNDPLFLPTALLDNMANFQSGLVKGIARFAEALAGALETHGGADDLSAAAERLARPGTVWIWDTSRLLGFLGRSENQYREGLLALEGFNVALAEGTSRLPREPAVLRALCLRMAVDLGEAAQALGDAADKAPVVWGGQADDQFYRAKGLAYAYAVLVRGLEDDFGAVIRGAEATGEWKTLRRALDTAAAYAPLMIVNGGARGLFASHPRLAVHYLQSARWALERMADTLA